MFCHNCGASRLPEAKFCPLCGCRLTDLSQLTPTPAGDTPVAAPPAAEAPIPKTGTQIPDADMPAEDAAVPVSAPEAVQPEPQAPVPVPPTAPTVPAPPAAAPYIPADRPVSAAPKKGRHRVPLLIMAGMVLVGLILFLATAGRGGETAQDPTAAPSLSDTPWFRNDEGTLYFDASLYTGSTELTIPETVDGAAVVCISEDCFAGNTTITTVILPEGLEEIGSGAFAGCTSMRGIFIPESVKLIGSGAFRDCTKLEAICIPGSVEAIGYNAFRGCIKLKYVIYEGQFREWLELYSGTIASGTQVYCDDGTYSHSAFAP